MVEQSGRAPTRATPALDQVVAIEHRVNRALGRNGNARESEQEAFADFASTHLEGSRFTFKIKFST
jgi:hypothetical protein